VELRHFRYVVALADELHFGRAAKRLHMSQPPLSQQLKKLEEELGVELFFRTRREVRLTEFGRRFVAEARKILEQVRQIEALAGQVNKGEVGQLKIGNVTSSDSTFALTVTECVQAFTSAYPSVQIALKFMTTAEQERGLEEKTIDVGFAALPLHSQSFDIDEVCAEALSAVVPPGHALASEEQIGWGALASEPLIWFSREVGGPMFDILDGYCRADGATFDPTYKIENVVSGLSMVRAKMGVSLAPESLACRYLDLVFKPLGPPIHILGMGLAYPRSERSTITDHFIEIVHQFVARRSQESEVAPLQTALSR
jgi:DNA-binding transcriptional LysR family regulator